MDRARFRLWVIVVGMLVAGGALGAAVPDSGAIAGAVFEKAGFARGICCVVGAGQEAWPLDLAAPGGLLVHVLDANEKRVAALRETAATRGLDISHVLIERAPCRSLPYADNMVDLVVIGCDERASGLAATEVLRALRPLGKAVIFARKDRRDALLKQWAAGPDLPKAVTSEDRFGAWAVIQKPAPKGMDNWSHWEHGPDNNPVSHDTVIRAPYMTQWLAKPYYIAMPAITTAAGGRTFLAMGHIAHHEREEAWLNTILARNGYNGTELWRRRVPDGYLVHRSAFIATDDVFYMIDPNGGCLLLNPETGDEMARVRIPEVPGDWKWIALENGTLFALVGEQKDPPETTIVRSQHPAWSWGELSKGYYQQPEVPWGFGQTLLAYDLKAKKLRWSHHEPSRIDSRAMVLGEGKVFFYEPEARMGCLDAASGAVCWTNDDANTRKLINEPGQNLTSTPGFRTGCYCVYTPRGLFFEAQTQENVVAVSKDDGKLLWRRGKTTSNPNVVYLDDRILVGIGKDGNTLALDPASGATIEDIGFCKRSCARLTATPDSLFCRGYPEGLTRYDRKTKTVLFDGAVRPSCNDGAIGANGLLYVGPWLCDCNLSLMGTLALCSAGTGDSPSPAAPQLETVADAGGAVAPFDASGKDWFTYRGNNAHSGSSSASVASPLQLLWTWQPPRERGTSREYEPSAPVTAGGLIFLAGSDGVVRAFTAERGAVAWTFQTLGPIVQPPTIWEGRAYVGSGDGYVYALEAATGRLLWRFRAAPTERRILVYGALQSTWPVNSGILVQDGIAYCAAGIIDYDGTYLYALDARTGALKWQNTTSGHLNKALRKGVSAQGDMAIMNGALWMAGGNVISPAQYRIEDGVYNGPMPKDGSPESNRGEEIAVFHKDLLLFGGRLHFSAAENVINPNSFLLARNPRRGVEVSSGQTAPVWDDALIVLAPTREAPPTAYAADALADRITKSPKRKSLPAPVWRARGVAKTQSLAFALAADSLVAAYQKPRDRTLEPAWEVALFNRTDGASLCEDSLPGPVRQNGLAIDRDGRVVVALANGGLVCFGGAATFQAYLVSLAKTAETDAGRKKAIEQLEENLSTVRDPESRSFLIGNLEKLGVDAFAPGKKAGCIQTWRIVGPVPCDDDNPVNKTFVGEPEVKMAKPCRIAKQELAWQKYATVHPTGFVDLAGCYGDLSEVAAYAYATITLPEARDLVLKLGSNDGFKCWFNNKEVGRFDGGRSYVADQDAIPVHAKKGENTVLLKITQLGGAWGFGVRVTDAAGNPVEIVCATP